MSDQRPEVINDKLSKQTSVFGLRVWVVLGVCLGAAFVLILFLITVWLASKRSKKTNNLKIPLESKEIQEIRIEPNRTQLQTHPVPDSEITVGNEGQALLLMPPEEEYFENGKSHLTSYEAPRGGSGGVGGDQMSMMVGPDVSHLGWGHWYTLRELEASTNGFADENVIGQGGYGIVYHGVLEDNTQVAVKNLLNNRGQAEKEFKVEVEAIGRVRHKNLVRLLGYCAEGSHRMLVYEYVNSGNLEQWLHGDVGSCSPLTWEIRMNIIICTAKGLTYLHEGLEPKVVHRDIKSSNILLDKLWNAKVSDFGLAKLIYPDNSFITTRVMGTFGYVAPEYASTGMLNERSDVYGFGILIMEIISGRNPVDYSKPPDEVNLVEWLKRMVTERTPERVVDPKILEKPCSRALKRVLLVALRCVDPNSQKRPKMGHVVHMLEANEFPFKDDRRAGRDPIGAQSDDNKDKFTEKAVTELGNRTGFHDNETKITVP
ncbi:probable serine/threonine-protein kinase At1g01540 isoform X3 [Mercurialis annua]|uniref:probable serine/threonine-protein kinase At1g01540 isoform X3 n=1 Tax=Mercurialis annua TaxID=3986 RepID=UPI00215F5F69|nr:probable serine/threonine-protein kinase At1g01540 isoform X3 [Mercurialis annua]XP_050206602.1 probable serine/threonine-protein kinase At1g01540 isoform X3 [Mercurialis annua]XP_050206603.1 probable serine/threonine-protein kinase At1g01540 isoform X3 [Mercurialis annua]XP_050206604.1 probable serine/threonine-protein kinase At1g01540 isoform X3 [Mercurialis annua]